MKNGYTTLEKAEENRKQFKSDINEKVKWRNKSKEQNGATKNI